VTLQVRRGRDKSLTSSKGDGSVDGQLQKSTEVGLKQHRARGRD
jgi:hypothetical protein